MKIFHFTLLLLLIVTSCARNYDGIIGNWSLVDIELEKNASEKLKSKLEQTRDEIVKNKGFMNFLNEHKLIMGDKTMTTPSHFEYKIENDNIVFDERNGQMNMEIISLNSNLLKIKPSKTEGSEHVTILVFKRTN
jgi:phage antirepressor YoqD-like protein